MSEIRSPISPTFPIYYKKMGRDTPFSLEGYQFEEISDKVGNYFIWDGEHFYWNDHEVGFLEIDFLSPKQRWRFERVNKAQEPLLRALGWKSNETKIVFDLTAGLGRDSSLLLFAGFNVIMFERNPVLQCLLAYALKLFKTENRAENIHLEKQDSIHYLTNIEMIPDLIYLDPMYPERKKSALVKKELRIIRNLVGSDDDSQELLTAAIQTGVSRIVVKRPIKAEYIGDLKPHHSVESPNTRFDVYMNHHKFS